jgi:spermidine synthase
VLVVLLALVAGSGCAALIYEVVWFQLLQLVIGSSAVSLGVLLGTFMGGMCLGSLALPRVVSPRHHPLIVYAMLELATGLVAVGVVYAMPWLTGVYVASVGRGLPAFALRAAFCAFCLLPPTILIGATLPAIARWMAPTTEGVSRLALLYGGNIAGAVLGSLVAGFYLLRLHDMATATYVAAAINMAVAALALGASRALPYAPMPRTAILPESAMAVDALDNRVSGAGGVWPVYVVIGLSGTTALGAEVVWTRMLALSLGATVYTFSIILAVFLIGLGIGSAVASVLLRRNDDARTALGVCQLLLSGAIACTAFLVARTLPYWSTVAASVNLWSLFGLDLVRAMVAILPATCLWGASFPLALAAAARGEQDPGRLVGRVYAINTFGAIVGAVGFSLVVIPLAGVAGAERLLIAISCAAAALALLPTMRVQRITTVAGVALIAFVLASNVPGLPPLLVAYGRRLPEVENPTILYVGEGVNASVAVSEHAGGLRSFHVSGKVEASTDPVDMRLQRLLGNLPALTGPTPKSVLVVGFGSGVTAGSFVPHPDVERIVICEIEQLIPERVAPYFARENYSVLSDPRVRLVIDDARHYVLTTRDTFDVITSDPIHPWVKGAATLYTKEYFELLKQHLNRGGIVAQWVPLYESDTEVVRSEIATFFDVFPHATVWGNPHEGLGYDVVLIGTVDRTPIDVDALQRRLERPEYAGVAESLRNVGLFSAVDLLGTYAADGRDLAAWLTGATLNHDRNLRLQYLAGLGLHVDHSGYVYGDILGHRRFPDDLFIASPEMKRQLSEAAARLRVGP